MRATPGFELADAQGYGTPAHLSALRLRPPSPLHRRSFSPMRWRREDDDGRQCSADGTDDRPMTPAASSICGCTPSTPSVDSVVRVPELVAAVAAAGMPAVALTDQSNLFAMVKFYREALERGVKPLIGVDLLLREEGERRAPRA